MRSHSVTGPGCPFCASTGRGRAVPYGRPRVGWSLLPGRSRTGLPGARPWQPGDCVRGRRITAAQGAGSMVCQDRMARRPWMRAAAEQEESRMRRWNRGTYWTPCLRQLRVAAGHRLGTGSARLGSRSSEYSNLCLWPVSIVTSLPAGQAGPPVLGPLPSWRGRSNGKRQPSNVGTIRASKRRNPT